MSIAFILANLVVTPDQAVGIIDHASKQGVWWLFLCILAILLVCLIVAVVALANFVRNTLNEMRSDRRELGNVVQKNTLVLGSVLDRLNKTA